MTKGREGGSVENKGVFQQNLPSTLNDSIDFLVVKDDPLLIINMASI
jgi:hypothetical protein